MNAREIVEKKYFIVFLEKHTRTYDRRIHKTNIE